MKKFGEMRSSKEPKFPCYQLYSNREIILESRCLLNISFLSNLPLSYIVEYCYSIIMSRFLN